MPERVRKCPNCGSNLEASRFARTVTCAFCGGVVLLDPSVVEVSRYREAHADWRDPVAQGFGVASHVGGAAWAVGPRIAVGETTDVHVAVRARTPTELALVRLLRPGASLDRMDCAWNALRRLHASTAPGAAAMRLRVPEPVARGVVEAGPYAGRHVLLVRPAHGYSTTLAALRAPVDPRATVWVWRRVLEALAFVHASGLAHGAIEPRHVLLEAGEHGARLVGFGSAGPADVERRRADLRDSARTIVAALGGDPARGTADVPGPYAAILRAVAIDGATPYGDADAWAIRERLGSVGAAAFGRPTFCPLVPRG